MVAPLLTFRALKAATYGCGMLSVLLIICDAEIAKSSATMVEGRTLDVVSDSTTPCRSARDVVD